MGLTRENIERELLTVDARLLVDLERRDELNQQLADLDSGTLRERGGVSQYNGDPATIRGGDQYAKYPAVSHEPHRIMSTVGGLECSPSPAIQNECSGAYPSTIVINDPWRQR